MATNLNRRQHPGDQSCDYQLEKHNLIARWVFRHITFSGPPIDPINSISLLWLFIYFCFDGRAGGIKWVNESHVLRLWVCDQMTSCSSLFLSITQNDVPKLQQHRPIFGRNHFSPPGAFEWKKVVCYYSAWKANCGTKSMLCGRAAPQQLLYLHCHAFGAEALEPCWGNIIVTWATVREAFYSWLLLLF